jgi:hypothetical protein
MPHLNVRSNSTFITLRHLVLLDEVKQLQFFFREPFQNVELRFSLQILRELHKFIELVVRR